MKYVFAPISTGALGTEPHPTRVNALNEAKTTQTLLSSIVLPWLLVISTSGGRGSSSSHAPPRQPNGVYSPSNSSPSAAFATPMSKSKTPRRTGRFYLRRISDIHTAASSASFFRGRGSGGVMSSLILSFSGSDSSISTDTRPPSTKRPNNSSSASARRRVS